MNGWLEADFALLDTLLRMDDEHRAFELIANATRDMGFEYCSFGLKFALPLSRPAVVVFDTYPKGWMSHYQSQGYLAKDPTVSHAARSNIPLLWSDVTFQSAPKLWKDARDFGLHFGWAQPTRDPSAFSLLSVSRSAEALTQQELDNCWGRINWLSQVAHETMSRLVKPKLVPESRITLTPREREILRWAAEGKTNEEIGIILHISKSTVIFHIENAVEKLNSSNRTQAVVKAMSLGLLTFS